MSHVLLVFRREAVVRLQPIDLSITKKDLNVLRLTELAGGVDEPNERSWPKAEGQLSVYYAAKRTLTVICLSAVDNTQAPSLRDHLDESRNTMPAGPLR